MIIAGGGKSRSIGMVEIFAPPTDQQPAVQCNLLNMPGATERYGLTLDGTTACGGGAEKNCLTFTIDGTWTETDNLTELRSRHSSWASYSAGRLLLMGGSYSPKTTEKLQHGFDSSSIELEYSTVSACSINLGSKVILTGGYQGTRVITYYQDLTYDEKLPHLLGVRLDHGCSFFDNADGTKTLLVTGGVSKRKTLLSSTELLVGLGNARAWRKIQKPLPSARYGLRGANIDNKIFMTGGSTSARTREFQDDILQFNSDTETWELVGKMLEPRWLHAVDSIDYNISAICKTP